MNQNASFVVYVSLLKEFEKFQFHPWGCDKYHVQAFMFYHNIPLIVISGHEVGGL